MAISVGMVGGGPGSDIGAIHQRALRLDGRYRLDAGVFGRDRAAALALAGSLGVSPERAYPSVDEMVAAESERPDGIDLAVVATPNDTHHPYARAFLLAGVHVACEKPLATDASQAAELVRLAAERDLILAVAHCYSAYPMVRQAARMARGGELGRLRYVDVEHASGWAAGEVEVGGHRRVAWRMNPSVSGIASVVADVGTHALHLARYITGREVTGVSATLDTLVPGRRVVDNASVTLRFGDLPGRLWASMAATGHHHGLRIRVFGSRASLEWAHEDATRLTLRELDGGVRVLTDGWPGLSRDALRLNRAGLGHPEGFIEAFANFYADVADDIEARRDGRRIERELTYPSGTDGLVGVRFVDAVVASHRAGGGWVGMGE